MVILNKGDPPQIREEPLLVRLRAVLRGVWAVIVLVLSAIETLGSALTGIPRPSYYLRKLGHVIAEEYRNARDDVIDAEIIDEGNT